MKNKIIKSMLIILSISLIIPSIIYIVQNKIILGFETYYNFFINVETNKIISTVLYLVLYIAITIIYLIIIKQREIFKSFKDLLIYVTIISSIFLIMLPWTSSDIFYYMGVGELDSKYKQNPYYTTISEYYYNENHGNIEDEIIQQAEKNVWADTTVVYGPVAQLIFKICTAISMKNIDICLLVFKLLNLVIHIANCYLIYKISRKKIFSIIYGLNPYILIEFIGNVHNDIIMVFFTLIALYYLIKKMNIMLSIIFLALATGIKYYTILLLPVIILYYERKEKNIWKKILKCLQYGTLFMIIFFIEYIPYLENMQILLAMMPQRSRLSKSIYLVLTITNSNLLYFIKGITMTLFIYSFLKMCLKCLEEKNIFKILRRYNMVIICFLLILTNFQQWYLVWLFSTIIWQKSKMMKDIIGLTAITEIANTIYMFKIEHYIYDIYFIGTIIFLFIIWQIIETGNKKSWYRIALNGGKKIG